MYGKIIYLPWFGLRTGEVARKNRVTHLNNSARFVLLKPGLWNKQH